MKYLSDRALHCAEYGCVLQNCRQFLLKGEKKMGEDPDCQRKVEISDAERDHGRVS